MTTYNREYQYNAPKRRKQKYSMVQRVIDFSKAPVISGQFWESDHTTRAWAVNDVLQAIRIRAGETVLGVQVQIIKMSGTANTSFEVGYGSDTDRWGRYAFGTESNTGFANYPMSTDNNAGPDQFSEPLYFSSADTIDIKISKAITAGRIRLIVHLLEDDR